MSHSHDKAPREVHETTPEILSPAYLIISDYLVNSEIRGGGYLAKSDYRIN